MDYQVILVAVFIAIAVAIAAGLLSHNHSHSRSESRDCRNSGRAQGDGQTINYYCGGTPPEPRPEPRPSQYTNNFYCGSSERQEQGREEIQPPRLPTSPRKPRYEPEEHAEARVCETDGCERETSDPRFRFCSECFAQRRQRWQRWQDRNDPTTTATTKSTTSPTTVKSATKPAAPKKPDLNADPEVEKFLL